MVFRLRLPLAVILFALHGISGAGSALPQAPIHAEVRLAVANLLAERYVFPDRARAYASLLRDPVIASRLDREPTPEAFARAMLTTLISHAPDGHLNLFPPRHPRAQEVHRGVVGIAPTPQGNEERAAAERRANHHFTSVTVLEGNIGYLDFDRFPSMTPAARRTATAAMTMLEHVEAVIVDLRGNPGGADGMNQFLTSHFLPEAPVVITAREFRDGEGARRVDYPNDPALGGGPLSRVPVFVLVDGLTGSAAENMAFGLQGLARATVVGETTGGAAHSSQFHPLPHGFAIQVPIARSFNPRTGQDWEAVGVVPDVAVMSAVAVNRAYVMALDSLSGTATTPARRRELSDIRARLTAPPAPAAETLRPLAGTYGERYVISFDADVAGLVISRTDRSPRARATLRFLGQDTYVIGDRGFAHVRFERDSTGQVIGLRVRETETGSWQGPVHARSAR